MSPFTTGAARLLCNGAEYKPESDDLVAESMKVARKNGIRDFVIRIDGHTYNSPDELPTNSITALIRDVTVEKFVAAEVRTAQDVAAL